LTVIFNGNRYEKNSHNNRALRYLCFEIFNYYLKLHPGLSYDDIKMVFSSMHCNNHSVVLIESDWLLKPDNTRKRYFGPIDYNGLKLYFTTQWGNNGGDCDNINHMINFAKQEKFDIKVIENNFSQLANIKKNKIKNIILYGPPGVGKTHNYQRLISMIESGEDEKTIFDIITNSQSSEVLELNQEAYKEIENQKRVEFITFHQSYSYEDFIEGFRPTKEGNIKLKKGIFKTLAQKALDNKAQNYYIVIDEINRGNISKIFGELITLIEEDKRDVYAVTLPYSKEKFVIPSNLYIIATMNSTDKSIATIDIALRRRFTFLKMEPNSHLVFNEDAKRLMLYLNEYIEKTLGKDFLLGHSYFMGEKLDLKFVKEYKIRPLLEEYFYSDDNLDIDRLLYGVDDAL